MAKVRRYLFSATVVVVTGALASTVLPSPEGLALPAFGPEISTTVLGDEEPAGLIILTGDVPAPAENRGSQRRVQPDRSLSEADRDLLDAVDDALGSDRVPRRSDGSVDVPELLSGVGVARRDVRPVASGVWAARTTADPERIAELPGVVAVEEDFLLAPAEDALFDEQWGLWNTGQTIERTPGVPTADIGWRAANSVADGSGVVVAVIDSGVDLSHPDLSAAVWRNPGEQCGNGVDDDGNGFVDDCNGYDFVNRDGTPFDSVTASGAPVDNNHGTHVAGIIAATSGNGLGVAGVAPSAQIMSVKVFENGGTSLSLIIEAIDYASSNGADVINLSLGSPPGSPYSQALHDAVQRAEQRGSLVVVAAGNDSVDIDRSPVWPASLDNTNVVTVGASTNRDEVASFSNYGRVGVDVFAPGYEIVSTVPGGFARYHGTSMAAPMVSGIAAQVIDARGPMEPAVLRSVILDGAAPVSSFAGRSNTGGRASASGALGLAVLAPGAVGFTADGLAGNEGGVDATLTVGTPGAVEHGVTLEITLGVVVDGRANAVVGHELEVDAGGGSTTFLTSDLGAVGVELTDSQRAELALGLFEIQLATALPDGRYLLHVGASTSNGEVLRGAVAAFDIGQHREGTEPDPGGAVGDPTAPPDPVDDPIDDPAGPVEGPIDDPSASEQPSTGTPPSATGEAPSNTSEDGSSTLGGPTGIDGDASGGEPGPAPDAPGGQGGGTPTDDGIGAPPNDPVDPAPSDEPSAEAPTQEPGDEAAAEDDQSTGAGPGGTDRADSEAPALFPIEGPVSGGTIVKITGSFGPVSGVLFGEAASPFVFVADGYLLAETPRHVAGPFDVVILGPSGRITIPDGFVFVAESAGNEDAGSSAEPDRGGGDTGITPPPGPVVDEVDPTPPPPGPTPLPDSSSPTTSTTAPQPAEEGGPLLAGEPTTLENGLTVAPFGSGHPLGTGASVDPCRTDDCRAVVLP